MLAVQRCADDKFIFDCRQPQFAPSLFEIVLKFKPADHFTGYYTFGFAGWFLLFAFPYRVFEYMKKC